MTCSILPTETEVFGAIFEAIATQPTEVTAHYGYGVTWCRSMPLWTSTMPHSAAVPLVVAWPRCR